MNSVAVCTPPANDGRLYSPRPATGPPSQEHPRRRGRPRKTLSDQPPALLQREDREQLQPREERAWTQLHPQLRPDAPLLLLQPPAVPARETPRTLWLSGKPIPAPRYVLIAAQEGDGIADAGSVLDPNPLHHLVYKRHSALPDTLQYDMDEQDDIWLAQYNRDRSIPVSVSPELFERTITLLEQEWHKLDRKTPKPRVEEAAGEDSLCAICNDGECENSNAIVFCDGCNLAVHQDCYGVPYIPEGQWLCRKCHISPDVHISCVLCPNKDGAFKQTSTQHWCHLLCALWIPEIHVPLTAFLEPIDGIDHIPKTRWKLVCYLCNRRMGAAIQCYQKTCYTAFHVTCALRAGLYLDQRPPGQHDQCQAFCHKHHPSPPKDIEQRVADLVSYFRTLPTMEDTIAPIKLSLKKTSGGAPIIPWIVVKLISASLNIKKKEKFVADVARYWSLKREMKRGASLLKRLQLGGPDDPLPVSGMTAPEINERIQFSDLVLKDLENLSELIGHVIERDSDKLERAILLQEFVDKVYFPWQPLIRDALNKAKSFDSNNYFLSIPTIQSYREYISEPMTWNIIERRLDQYKYRSVSDFERDILLIFSNCHTFNDPDTPYCKAANTIRTALVPLIAAAKEREKSILAIDWNDLKPDGLSIIEPQVTPPPSPLSSINSSQLAKLEREVMGTPTRPRKLVFPKKKGHKKSELENLAQWQVGSGRSNKRRRSTLVSTKAEQGISISGSDDMDTADEMDDADIIAAVMTAKPQRRSRQNKQDEPDNLSRSKQSRKSTSAIPSLSMNPKTTTRRKTINNLVPNSPSGNFRRKSRHFTSAVSSPKSSTHLQHSRVEDLSIADSTPSKLSKKRPRKSWEVLYAEDFEDRRKSTRKRVRLE
ncbi:Peregrin [Neolecta irregularis DAH-3]|uniref:Peregrin n=1 Tax=Neolecta irregularis (strain DAH-3) TaxID=1198029 RepID=A0A1U7LMI9_NEOID|nr:Peregrin [Neolecta irregularis DAH-3]|eukprot:OLL23886.1 Peregrin [Neolecta irregularis DAH-3]